MRVDAPWTSDSWQRVSLEIQPGRNDLDSLPVDHARYSAIKSAK